MKNLVRGGALASGALLLLSMHVGAQIRQGGSGPVSPRVGRVRERTGHPEVLRNTRDPEFVGGERVIAEITLKHLDPKAAVAQQEPPSGIDGVIAYPGSRMLKVRGTKEAVAAYRSTLEKLDKGPLGKGAAEAPARPVRPELRLPAGNKVSLRADRVRRAGSETVATGHVAIDLGGGIELRADQVRLRTDAEGQRLVIEK